MPLALPLTSLISQGSTSTVKNRVLTAQFGDGYDQTVPDGINNIVANWNLAYENLTTAERNTLVTALNTVGSWDYLTWAPPDETTKRWKVGNEGYSLTPMSGDLWTVSFTLRQVF